MTDIPDEELGPIDYIVVEFPAGEQRFTGAMATALADLVDGGLIQVLDLLVLVKDADGGVEAYEIEDLGDLGVLAALEGGLAELLALEDVEHLAAAMEPGSAAGVIVWENSWAAPFAIAARESGGQLIAGGRIPTKAILAALESDTEGS